MLPVEMDALETGRRANTAGRVRRPCLTAAPRLAGTSVANFGARNRHSPQLGSLIGQIFGQVMLSKRRVHKPQWCNLRARTRENQVQWAGHLHNAGRTSMLQQMEKRHTPDTPTIVCRQGSVSWRPIVYGSDSTAALEPPEAPAAGSTPGCDTKHDCRQCA